MVMCITLIIMYKYVDITLLCLIKYCKINIIICVRCSLLWVRAAGFLYFWAIVFFVTTTLVALLKQEKAETFEEQSILQTYKQLYTIMRLPAVISLVIILLTSKVGIL